MTSRKTTLNRHPVNYLQLTVITVIISSTNSSYQCNFFLEYISCKIFNEAGQEAEMRENNLNNVENINNKDFWKANQVLRE